MVKIGTPMTKVGKKALLCGSGELGKEVALELQRYGVEVIACDRYADAPAMQVAHRSYVFSMLDGERLREVIKAEQPDYIIPEVEAIATPVLVELEQEGYHVTPTAKAVLLTMNREGIRRLAAEELGIKTSEYRFAGTEEEFHRFFEIVSAHLNKNFPHLKIGGPALASNLEWADRFLAYCAKNSVEMDFFSYHRYFGKMEKAIRMTNGVKALLDKYGYSNVEMIFNEWNYLANWTDEFVHTIEVINSYKGAAYAAAAMSTFQDSPVHMMMYYDARPGTAFNGLFDLYTSQPRHAYYALYSWKKLRELGTQVKTDVGGLKDFYATAAKGKNGKLALLLTYYTDDRNVVAPKRITIDFQGFEIKEAISHVLDRFKMHTETPIEIVNSKATIFMEPNSYILIELR